MRYIASDGSEWDLEYERPPVPVFNMDWNYVAADYQGSEDDRHGYAPTREAAIAAIESDHVEEVA